MDVLAKALSDADSRIRLLSADTLAALGAKAKEAGGYTNLEVYLNELAADSKSPS